MGENGQGTLILLNAEAAPFDFNVCLYNLSLREARNVETADPVPFQVAQQHTFLRVTVTAGDAIGISIWE